MQRNTIDATERASTTNPQNPSTLSLPPPSSTTHESSPRTKHKKEKHHHQPSQNNTSTTTTAPDDDENDTSKYGLSAKDNKLRIPKVDLKELQVLEELGRGVFGKVNKALWRGTIVAVKELKSKNENKKQFDLEIEIMSTLRHPNVVLLMGFCDEPCQVMVTEYLEGGDLHNLIEEYAVINKKGEAFPHQEASKIAKEIAMGMAWLHQSVPPIIHKDLKPRNIMLDAKRKPKIIDFGLSEEQVSKSIENKKIAGSASWMAPEMLKGESYTTKIDVFAYGIILWQLFTATITVYDTSKYDGLPSNQAFHKFVSDISNGMRPQIPQKLRTTSRFIVDKIESCWAYDPQSRPSFSVIAKELPIILLNDQDAIEMWQNAFNNREKVSLDEFYPALWRACSKSMPDPYDDKSPEAVQQRILHAVVIDQKKEMKEIDLERFSLLLHWYGPLHSNRSNLIDKLSAITGNSYFHGELSSTEAVQYLQAKSKKICFLIRTSNHPSSPFVLSVFEKAEVKHYRISFDRKNMLYTIQINNNKIQSEDLTGLIKTIKPILGLKGGVKCMKFSSLKNFTKSSYEITYEAAKDPNPNSNV